MIKILPNTRNVIRDSLLTVAIGLSSFSVYAQAVRTYNGLHNNIEHPDWGAYHGEYLRIAPNAYADSISQAAFPNKINPRIVSNRLFKQQHIIPSTHNLSAFVWVFGQFIDHDITLLLPNKSEPLNIKVPQCDSVFDPNCFGNAIIPLSRAMSKPGSGTDISNPRNYRNSVTSWIDGSMIYGSEKDRADYLRTFQGGKLKLGKHGLLPMNTMDNTLAAPVDPHAPMMGNHNRNTIKLFVAGDIRANENIYLTTMQTLFAREHNRLCEKLKKKYPEWSDEKLYQHARKIVSGEIQAIFYERWLPAVGIHLPDYHGYDPSIRPNITLGFATAAFRMGHSLLNGKLLRMKDNCQPLPGGKLELKDAFFSPKLLVDMGKISPFLKGMSYQVEQELDCKVVDNVRNFLFGTPGIGMDLAAVNIQRGRDVGLPGFNKIREAYGLNRIESFQELCANPELVSILSELYGSVDDVDPWVGMLAEDNVQGSIFGETLITIMGRQFQALRDGDRFYYENDPVLTLDEKKAIKNTTLHDIIVANSDLELLQENVFYAEPECLYNRIPLKKDNLAMYVFPNPTSSVYNLAIHSDSESKARFRVINSVGQVISESPLPLTLGMNTYVEALDENLPEGIYFLNITDENESNTIKIIKSR